MEPFSEPPQAYPYQYQYQYQYQQQQQRFADHPATRRFWGEGFHDYQWPKPHQIFGLMIFAVLLISFSWRMSADSYHVRHSVTDQLSFVVMASPLLILGAMHWLAHKKPSASSYSPSYYSSVPSSYSSAYAEAPRPSGLQNRHSGNGNRNSPWGVALLLLFLMVLISYQSEIQERTWFNPWFRRRRYY